MQNQEDGEVAPRGDRGDGGDGRSFGRGSGRGGRGGRDMGRGRGDGRGRGRPEDPNQCPIVLDKDGRLMLKATVMIMRELAGAVIGRGGEHVSAIRAETGALIHVCKPDFHTGVQGVDIFGNLPKIHQAQSKISGVLRDNAPDWSNDKEWGPRLKVQLLPDMVGTIIGKKGSNVQRINSESGALCRVSNQSDDTSLQLVQFYGTEEQVCHAFSLFLETLETYDVSSTSAIDKLQMDWRAREHMRRDDGYGRSQDRGYEDRRGYGSDRGPGSSRSYGGSDRGYGGPERSYAAPERSYGGPERGYGGPERGYGGPERGYGGSRDGYSSSRYEPYGGSDRRAGYGGGGSGGGAAYGRPDDRRDDRYQSRAAAEPNPYGASAPQMVVLPQQSMATTTMPTVLIQQADGTLVQAQVMTQPAGSVNYPTSLSVQQPQHTVTAAAAQSAIQTSYSTAQQPSAYNVQYAQPSSATGATAASAPMYAYQTVTADTGAAYGETAAEQQPMYGVQGQGMYSVASAQGGAQTSSVQAYRVTPQTQTAYQQQ